MRKDDKYYHIPDIMQLLGIGHTKAAEIVHDMNAELKSKGYIILRGKVPKKYVHEKIYI